MLELLKTIKNKSYTPKFIFLVWSLWKERNSIGFNQEKWNTHRVLHKARFAHQQCHTHTTLNRFHSFRSPFKGAHASSLSFHPSTIPIAWEPTPINSFKLNFDGPIKDSLIGMHQELVLSSTIICETSFTPALSTLVLP